MTKRKKHSKDFCHEIMAECHRCLDHEISYIELLKRIDQIKSNYSKDMPLFRQEETK